MPHEGGADRLCGAEAQVGELRETVGRVIREIRDFAFWNKECGEKGCRWCGVRGKI
jgi:hypothetical protein